MLKLQDAVKKFYIRCVAMGMSEKTLINYRYQFKAFNTFLNARDIAYMENITGEDVRAYLAYMRAKGYAPDTIKDRYVGLNTFFGFLYSEGLVPINPVKVVKKPKLPKVRARTFTTTELQKLLGFFREDSFVGLRNKLMIFIFYGTGIRKAELLGLSVLNLHLDMSMMTIIGKGNKERDVPLSSSLVKLLRRYLDRRADLLLDTRMETSALFVTNRGTPLTDGALLHIFRELKAGTGISGRRVSPHTFRHSFAKNFLLNGGELFVLQEILGHEDVSTTRIYVDYNKRELGQQMQSYCPLDNVKWSYLNS